MLQPKAQSLLSGSQKISLAMPSKGRGKGKRLSAAQKREQQEQQEALDNAFDFIDDDGEQNLQEPAAQDLLWDMQKNQQLRLQRKQQQLQELQNPYVMDPAEEQQQQQWDLEEQLHGDDADGGEDDDDVMIVGSVEYKGTAPRRQTSAAGGAGAGATAGGAPLASIFTKKQTGVKGKQQQPQSRNSAGRQKPMVRGAGQQGKQVRVDVDKMQTRKEHRERNTLAVAIGAGITCHLSMNLEAMRWS